MAVKIAQHYKNALIALFSRIIGGGTQLLSIPIVLKSLGLENYAIFTLLTNLTVWFLLLDLGIGQATQNYIAKLRVHKESLRVFLGSLLPLIVLILVLELLFIVLIGNKIEFELLKNFPSYPKNIFILCSVLYLLFVFTNIANRIFLSLHKLTVVYIYQIIGYVFSFLGVVGVCFFLKGHEKLIWVTAIWLAGSLIPNLILFYGIFKKSFGKIRINFQLNKMIIKRGLSYNLYSILSVLIYNIDYIFISRMLKATDLVIYSTFMKIFMFILFAYAAILQSDYPLLAKNYYLTLQGQKKSFWPLIMKSLLPGMAYIIVAGITLICLRGLVTRLILHNVVSVSFLLSFFFLIYGIIRVWTDTFANALMAFSEMRTYIIAALFQVLFNFAGIFYFSSYLGLSGVLLAFIISSTATVSWVLPLTFYKKIKNLTKI